MCVPISLLIEREYFLQNIACKPELIFATVVKKFCINLLVSLLGKNIWID